MSTVFKPMFGNNLIKTDGKIGTSDGFVDRIYEILMHPMTIDMSYNSDPDGMRTMAEWNKNFDSFDARERFRWLLKNCTFVITLEPLHIGEPGDSLGWKMEKAKEFYYALKVSNENISVVFKKDIQKLFDSYKGENVLPTNNISYVSGNDYSYMRGSPYYKWDVKPTDDHYPIDSVQNMVISPDGPMEFKPSEAEKDRAYPVSIPQSSVIIPTLGPDRNMLGTIEPHNKKSLLFCTGACDAAIKKMNYVQYDVSDSNVSRSSPLNIIAGTEPEKTSLMPGLSMTQTLKVKYENQPSAAFPSHLEYLDPKLIRYPNFDYQADFTMKGVDLVPFGGKINTYRSRASPSEGNFFNREGVEGSFFTGVVEADRISSKFVMPHTNEQLDISILILLTNPMKVSRNLTDEDIKARSILHNAQEYRFNGEQLIGK